MKYWNYLKRWEPNNLEIFMLLMPLFVLFMKFQIDKDFWFIYNIGEAILEKGFIHYDLWTIHDMLYFVPQQWLTSIIFFQIYSRFQEVGIYIFQLIINAIIVLLSYKLSFYLCKRKNISILITVIINYFIIGLFTISTRPHIFDVVILLLELYLLEKYMQERKQKYLCFLPILSVLLINLHASIWPMLFVFLIPYFVENIYLKIVKKIHNLNKELIIFTLLSIVCGFINPYGFELMTYLFTSFGVKEINEIVVEMQPFIINTNIISAVLIFITFFSFYYNKGNNKLRYFLLFSGTTFLGFLHERGLLFVYITSILALSYNFKLGRKNIVKRKLSKFDKIIYICCIIIFISIIAFNIKIDQRNPLSEIADYLDANRDKDIKIYTGYLDAAGNYLEYRGYKCYIDARAEMFLKVNNKKEDIFKEYYDLYFGIMNIGDFLEKYDFDYLVVHSADINILSYLITEEKYEMVLSVYDDNKQCIYYLFKNNI